MDEVKDLHPGSSLIFRRAHPSALSETNLFQETKTYRPKQVISMWNVKTRERRGEEEEPAGERGNGYEKRFGSLKTIKWLMPSKD